MVGHEGHDVEIAGFRGFDQLTVHTTAADIFARVGGEGPPLLLLHGHPQTHVMWHKVATQLSRSFTVVAADLRGYGSSSKPSTGRDDAELYCKRAMAQDQVEMMSHLGFDRFSVVGHDRGARCAYRMALDHPAAVGSLTVMDIIPTGEALRLMDDRFAYSYWHWFFLAQPFDLPERMLNADPSAYYRRWTEPPSYITTQAAASYRDNVRNPSTIHAICADYRAGLSLDRAHDEEDRGRRRITCPMLALWAARGELSEWYDVVEVWRQWADNVCGAAIPSGHFMAEEAPEQTLARLMPFLTGADQPA